MEYGLLQEDILSIRKIFAAYPKIQKVILFGSRAKGTYKEGSDIDLAVVADKFTFDDLLELGIRLENLGYLYQFDVQNLGDIKDPAIVEHIKRVGKVFYSKGDAL